jgi:hypothetical protein
MAGFRFDTSTKALRLVGSKICQSARKVCLNLLVPIDPVLTVTRPLPHPCPCVAWLQLEFEVSGPTVAGEGEVKVLGRLARPRHPDSVTPEDTHSE